MATNHFVFFKDSVKFVHKYISKKKKFPIRRWIIIYIYISKLEVYQNIYIRNNNDSKMPMYLCSHCLQWEWQTHTQIRIVAVFSCCKISNMVVKCTFTTDQFTNLFILYFCHLFEVFAGIIHFAQSSQWITLDSTQYRVFTRQAETWGNYLIFKSWIEISTY